MCQCRVGVIHQHDTNSKVKYYIDGNKKGRKKNNTYLSIHQKHFHCSRYGRNLDRPKIYYKLPSFFAALISAMMLPSE